MSFNFVTAIAVWICLTMTVRVQAFETLTLQGSIQEAEGNNPTSKAAKAAVDAAVGQRQQSFAGFLPHFGVSATNFFAAQYQILNVNFLGQPITFPEGFPQTEVDLNAELLLFDGFETWNRYDAAVLSVEASELELNRTLFQIEEDVRKKFYTALASQDLAIVALHNIQTLDDHLQLAKATARTGFTTKFEVLRIDAQLEEARAEKVLDDDNVALARKDLYMAMGEENDDGRPLVGKLIEPDEKMIPDHLLLNTSDRTDYKALLKRKEAGEKGSKASTGFWWPHISLIGIDSYYQFGSFSPAILSSGFQQSYSFGVKLTWNLFDGGISIGKEKEAAALSEATEQKARAGLLSASQEFEKWKRHFLYNTVLYRARVRAVAEFEESVRLAKAGLKAGIRTHTEVLDAELDLIRARAGVVHAELDAAEALSNLELAAGKKLNR